MEFGGWSVERTIERAAFISLLVYTVVAPLRGTVSIVQWIPKIAVVFAATTTLLYLIYTRAFVASRTTLLVGVLLVGLVLSTMILNTFYPYTTWSMLDIIDLFLPAIVLFWLPVLLIGTTKEGRWRSMVLLHGHLLSMVFVSVMILLIGFQVIEPPVIDKLGRRLIPFNRNTYPINSYTIYMIYIVPAAVYAFGQMLSDEHRTLYGAMFLLIALTGFLTQFRKVYVGILVGIVLYAIFDSSSREVMLKFLLLSSPLLLLMIYGIYTIGNYATSQRLIQFLNVLPFAINHPLGVGHGGTRILIGSSAHNLFLDTLSEYGFIAFGLLVAIFILSIVRALRVGKHSEDIVIMSLGASLIALFVGFQFQEGYYFHRFWLLVGLFHVSVDVRLTDVFHL